MPMPEGERKRIAWEAAIWLSILEECPSQKQRSGFLAWLEMSRLHGEMFRIVASQFPEALDKRSVNQPANEPMQPEILNSINRHPDPRPTVYDRSPRFARVTILTVVAIFIASAALWMHLRAPRQALDVSVIYSDAGSFELGNHSTMTLDNQSKAEVQRSRNSPETRVHILQGHAAFTGTHDPSAPLRIFSNNTVTDVLGTSFDVYHEPDSTTIEVTHGRVHVVAYCPSRAGAPIDESFGIRGPIASEADLQEGQIVKVSTGNCSDPLDVRSVQDRAHQQQVDASKDWLNLNNQTIQEAAQEFNQRGEHIVVSDPSLGSQRISGSFKPSQIESFLNILKRDYHAQVRRDTTPDGSKVIYLSLYTRK